MPLKKYYKKKGYKKCIIETGKRIPLKKGIRGLKKILREKEVLPQ